VLVHRSSFCQSNGVVVLDGASGVLLIDPGILGDELLCLANDVRALGRSVVAGFSTHPHWDHLLWHDALGEVPRFATASCADTVRARLSGPGWKAGVSRFIPPDIVAQVPLDLLDRVTGLPADAAAIPWDGPRVRIVEHHAHAPGHAALVIEERRVLVAGDMLSDILIPMLDQGSPDPLEGYGAALELLQEASADVDAVVPGHGSVGGTAQLQERIDQDRAYVDALRGGRVPSDPRVGPPPAFEGVTGVHDSQLRAFARPAHDDVPPKWATGRP
jgi:glyoxylase-like metal-dependent hydrolase (beta-lactamase superfamily II)